MGPTWGPPGSCRPQMGPMLTPCTLLSGMLLKMWDKQYIVIYWTRFQQPPSAQYWKIIETRTPVFWGYPAASWLPILLIHIGSQVKRRQCQSYKFKEFAKISKFWLKNKLYMLLYMHLLFCMLSSLEPSLFDEDTSDKLEIPWEYFPQIKW